MASAEGDSEVVHGKEVYSEENSNDILQQLNKYRASGMLCDVEIVVDGMRYPAHKTILSASSDYFKAMFRTNMKEKFSNRVELKELNTEAVGQVIDYIYTSKIYLDDKNVSNILQVASIMMIKGLLKEIDLFLLESVCPGTCLHFREISILFSLLSLRELVEDCILANFGDVSSQEKFAELSACDVKKYLSSDYLEVESEDEVFKALMNWVSKDLENRQQHFYELFSEVRLHLVSKEYLFKTIKKETLVKNDLSCRDLLEDVYHFYYQPEDCQIQYERSPKRMHLLTNSNNIQTLYFKKTTETKQARQPGMIVSCSSAMAVHGNTAYFCGGFSQGSDKQALKVIISFDGQTWNIVGEMTYARANAMAVFVDENLMIFGGENNNQWVTATEMFVTGKSSNDTQKNLPNGRSCAAAVSHNGSVYIIGGYSTFSTNNQTNALQRNYQTYQRHVQHRQVHNTVHVFGSVNKVQTATLNVGKASFGCVQRDNKIFTFGGIGSYNQLLNVAEFCDTSTKDKVWTRLTPATLALGKNSAWLYSNNQIFVVAGTGQALCYQVSTGTWTSSVRKTERKHSTDSELSQDRMCTLATIPHVSCVFCLE